MWLSVENNSDTKEKDEAGTEMEMMVRPEVREDGKGRQNHFEHVDSSVTSKFRPQSCSVFIFL